MIREDDERLDLIPANLRDASRRPENWDVPGLMIDAADRIEWLERANADETGEQMKLRLEFGRHSEAAQSLYGDIYRIVIGILGGPLPNGCSPREAVSLLAGSHRRVQADNVELRRHMEAAIDFIKQWMPRAHMTRDGIRAMIRIKADEA